MFVNHKPGLLYRAAEGKVSTMNNCTPFRIAVSDDDLADLRRRLECTRWPEAECADDWSQGMPLELRS